MFKLTKTLLPLSWMCLIYILSDIPYNAFPVGTTSAQQILAHIFLYGVLAYLLILAVASWRKSQFEGEPIRRREYIFSPSDWLTGPALNWKLNFFVIAFCVFYGITDEYHQGFVPGRFVSFADLGFDAVGAVLGISFYWLIIQYYCGRKYSHKSTRPHALRQQGGRGKSITNLQIK